MSSTTTNTGDEQKKKYNFALDMLATIKTAQIQNGLRHGDYARYRSYCTRRIQRISKSLKFTHGRVYHKKEIEPHIVTDVRYLHLVLMMCERAWAHAMLLKEDVENYSARFYASRRLNKAAKWAKKLVSLCHVVADQRTTLEVESYAAWFEGNILMEHEDWAGAREQLIRARTVYEELGKVGTTEQQERCNERVAEIEPTIRYCNYSIDQDKALFLKLKSEADTQHGLDLLKSQLEGVLTDIRKKEVNSMNEVSWKGNKVPIKNESVRMSIISADSIAKLEMQQAATADSKLQLYDKIFIHYNDALKVIGNEINTAKVSKKSAAEINSLEDLKDYVSYAKIEKTMQRNLMLVESLEAQFTTDTEEASSTTSPKTDEIVRLYEIIIENITELNTIRDSNDEVIAKQFAAKLLSFKALRCLYLAYSYAKISKWSESSALFERCKGEIKDALDHHKECTPIDMAMVDKLNQSLARVESQHSRVYALGFLDKLNQKKIQEGESTKTTTTTTSNHGGLLDNLNNFDSSFLFSSNSSDGSSGKLIDFPPSSFEAIPCKPLLFDLALLSCNFPNLAERKKAPRTASIFNRLFWGSK